MQWFARFWAAPITLLALPPALMIRLTGGRVLRQGIAWEAAGGCAPRLLWLMNPWMRIDAITLGHIIIAKDAATADCMRTHEQVHVRQYERWGMFFPLAYAAASINARARGACPYRGNAFEQEAFATAAATITLAKAETSGQNTGRD